LVDAWTFVLASIPAMIVIGMRHALEVDHITAIDNLVRLHNASKKSRIVGTGFSSGHMLSVLAEMILIIYVIGNATSGGAISLVSFWGGIIGAIGIGAIGCINIYSMKKWGKSAAGIIATKVLSRTGILSLGPFGSALVTGIVFGLGFDTATQIAALTLSAIASATLGIQVALVLAGFFALGMIPMDTLDSFVLRTAFSRIFTTKGFRYLSYSLSAVALSIAGLVSYSILANLDNIVPAWLGPAMAVGLIAAAFGYGYGTRKKRASSGIVSHTDHHYNHSQEDS
jgi:high-affinity nickel-transport protein